VNPRRLLALVPASAVLACAVGGGPAATRFQAPSDARSTREPRLTLELPFECRARVVVSQGHDVYSHVRDERFAWDFRATEGTPVLAAAGGVVRLARSDSTRGKCDRSLGPEANYVIVSHGGGLETQYLHLSRVFVKAGDRIATGDVIGEVGATGFACGPHLHFQVQRALSDGWANPSVPARFLEIGDPAEGQVVVSDNCRRGPLTDSGERVRASPGAISGK
jgi:murein DD-endopeptidase MepM/ murein hydrolase activator NlpD